jgi:DNA-binding XRE family transcriptional regulator
MLKEEIGRTIEERRKFLRITQKELAQIVDISLRSLVAIENGKGNPTLVQLQKITEALGLKIEIEVK